MAPLAESMANTPPVLPAAIEYVTVSPVSESLAETAPTTTAVSLPSAFSASVKL